MSSGLNYRITLVQWQSAHLGNLCYYFRAVSQMSFLFQQLIENDLQEQPHSFICIVNLLMICNRGRDTLLLESYSHLILLRYIQFGTVLERNNMYPHDKLIILNINLQIFFYPLTKHSFLTIQKYNIVLICITII